jgi:phosphopentomutase
LVAIKRIFLVVLDGVGAGELPDAAKYGDEGSDTLVHTAQAVGGLKLPNLGRLGLGNIRPIQGVPPNAAAVGCWGRMRELSPGKDSVTGHWEMMGVVLDRAFPTYPHGFPPEVLRPFEAAIGTKSLGNMPASGTEIIERLGGEHVRTGYPIVYTSADSVFQIAAHEAVIPIERLYAICEIARAQLTGENAVGRVIARPFEGGPGGFRRTERRKDFPLTPPPTCLDALAEAGHKVHAIGKIWEFFNGRGIDSWDHTTNNADHMRALVRAAAERDASLVFANLEDFDMLYGHRNDPQGFATALETFDAALPEVLSHLGPADLLILTNDHGNDPTTPSTDHSREHAFLLAYCPAAPCGKHLGDRESFSDLSATIRAAFGLAAQAYGASFLPNLTA